VQDRLVRALADKKYSVSVQQTLVARSGACWDKGMAWYDVRLSSTNLRHRVAKTPKMTVVAY